MVLALQKVKTTARRRSRNSWFRITANQTRQYSYYLARGIRCVTSAIARTSAAATGVICASARVHRPTIKGGTGCPREQNLVHHSGSGWLARPSPWGTFTSYSLPGFPGALGFGSDSALPTIGRRRCCAAGVPQQADAFRSCRIGAAMGQFRTHALQKWRQKLHLELLEVFGEIDRARIKLLHLVHIMMLVAVIVFRQDQVGEYDALDLRARCPICQLPPA
jgi:hypothetical protein